MVFRFIGLPCDSDNDWPPAGDSCKLCEHALEALDPWIVVLWYLGQGVHSNELILRIDRGKNRLSLNSLSTGYKGGGSTILLRRVHRSCRQVRESAERPVRFGLVQQVMDGCPLECGFEGSQSIVDGPVERT